MVTILPAVPKKLSFGEKLSAGIGRGLDIGQQLMSENALRQEKQNLEKMHPELAGMPSDFQKLAYEYALKSDIENKKLQGKENLLGQKQDYFNKLFGEGKSPLNNGDRIQREQNMGFDASQIPDSAIAQASIIDPNLARSLQHAKDVSLREKRAEQTYELQKQKQSPEFQREQRVTGSQAEADVKYNQSLQESAKLNELKEKTLDRLEKLNIKGVTGKPYEKILEKAGLINLTSEGRREFAADVKNLITDIRSILGAQFTGFEFQTILNAYPSADFSKDANAAIIKNLKEFQDIKKKEFEYAKELKKENNGKIPEDFQSRVNERVHEYALSRVPEIKQNLQKVLSDEYGIEHGYVLMFDPNGEPLQVDPADVSKYEELGASLP
jgi:hypothetical protein